jgi:precorrin-2 dehydrogenase/sirohydrochlorin ferrochelatase
MTGYPITLVSLETTRCVVIGGGEVAARKVTALQTAGARPVVISPDLGKALQEQARAGEIEAIRREYRTGDLAGARLVIAATDDPDTNQAVWNEAKETGCLVNVVDDPEHCNFYVPATVRRGALCISVSTGGSSPLLARRIRETLEGQFDAAYEPYLALLAELRPIVQAQISDPVRRKAVWESLLDSELLELLRSGEPANAQQQALGIVEAYR